MSGPLRPEIAVATITLVREPSEAELLRASLTALARIGIPVFVCDGGSGDGFLAFLRALPDVTVVPSTRRGLVGQVRAAMIAASEGQPDYVLYTEADKLQFFQRHLRAFIAHAPLDTNPGAVLAARSAAALGTFPPMQQHTEGTINKLCGDFLRVEGDYSFGPFLLRNDLVPHVDRIESDDLGWGWRHFIFAIAHRLKLPLTHITEDFFCPEDQRHEDERERLHRVRQLGQNVNGLLAGLTVGLKE